VEEEIMSAVPPADQSSATPSPRHPVTRSRRWVWFFLLVGVLGAAGVSVEIWSNLTQQLTPEQLAGARRRWRDKGPRDYVLEYAVKREYNPDPAGRAPVTYTVHVKDGKVESATAGEREFGSMDDLFDKIERQLDADIAAGGKRNFIRADFDRTDGHVTFYRRSVMATHELLEVVVQLRKE
jgi:hypothetical protein